MKPLRVLSLFDGISCARLALNKANIPIETYYASEIDKDAIQITQKNFPDTIQLGDVTKIDFAQFKDKIDIIFAGFPCQDLSICKQDRQGLDGKRSGLFFNMLEAIETIKPKYFLVENVASMSKENKAIISELLGVQPIMINSSVVCAQQRKRLYWTNIPAQEIKTYIGNPSIRYVYQILETESPDIFNEYAIDAKYAENSKCLNSKSGRGGVPNLQPSLQDRIYDIFGKFPSLTASRLPYIAEPTYSDKSMRIGNMRRQTDGTVNTAQEARVYSVKGKSVSLCSGGGGWGVNTGLYAIDLPDGNYYIRKLTPLEAERLQTLPDNYTEGLSRSARYKVVGNGWTVDVIAEILKKMK